MIDLNSSSRISDRITFLIDEAIAAVIEPPREYLGASVIGHECERHVQFHLLAARGEVSRKPVPPRTRRIFDRGNIYEERARRWLKDAGFLFGLTKQGKGFSDFDGQFRGHVDGVITGWRESCGVCPIALPVLWECKCLGAKGWKSLSDNKLRSYSSTYYAQVQLYMHYMGLPQCLFTAVNADTMDLYHELVPFDETEAALSRSRVQNVIAASDAGELVSRISKDPCYYICRFCDFREVCPCP